ncbi:hypothetical protein [uncultured Muribaculum sp.]|uniref:hypothetical protein n=1 Tax=uncultured Muribaculum sp. TaxID=1918613 RepID=UPI002595EA4A|nr:hypothetical protein [uncultured Muribaculum sp.]
MADEDKNAYLCCRKTAKGMRVRVKNECWKHNFDEKRIFGEKNLDSIKILRNFAPLSTSKGL